MDDTFFATKYTILANQTHAFTLLGITFEDVHANLTGTTTKTNGVAGKLTWQGYAAMALQLTEPDLGLALNLSYTRLEGGSATPAVFVVGIQLNYTLFGLEAQVTYEVGLFALMRSCVRMRSPYEGGGGGRLCCFWLFVLFVSVVMRAQVCSHFVLASSLLHRIAPTVV